ncbi:Uncharacterized protein APZ42_003601, partial [Daphnia magna]
MWNSPSGATDLNVVTLNPTAARVGATKGSNEVSNCPSKLAGKTQSSVRAVHPGGTSKIPNGGSNSDCGGPWLL